MLQTKVFFACNDPEGLEREMNDWLARNKNIEVVEWKVTSTGRMDHKVTVICIYKKS